MSPRKKTSLGVQPIRPSRADVVVVSQQGKSAGFHSALVRMRRSTLSNIGNFPTNNPPIGTKLKNNRGLTEEHETIQGKVSVLRFF